MQLSIDFFATLPSPLPTPSTPGTPLMTWVAPLSPARLIGHALDAGYGAPAHLLNTASMPLALQQFMVLRMRGTWKLLKMDPAGYEAHDFVSKLDSTDKGDASTILGSICARAAFERWLVVTHPLQSIHRFWHYSVYTRKSVARWVLPWTDSAGNEAPDFLVCTKVPSGGQRWYVLEAKGTLGGVNWYAIETGLHQAQRVGQIQTFPWGGWHKVQKVLCSQAHLDASTNILKTTLVDPLPLEDSPAVQLCEPVGVLHQLARSAIQWELLTSGKASPSGNGHRWAKVTRGLGFGAPLELGLSNAVYDSKATIGSLIRAFDLLVEHVVEPYLERVGQQASYSKSSAAFEQIVISAREVLKGQKIDKSTRRLVSELLNALQESSSPSPANWGEMMSLLVTARVDLSGQGKETTSVAEWASALDTQVSVLPLVDRLARGADSADTRFLLNGLAIRQQNKPKLEARSSV